MTILEKFLKDTKLELRELKGEKKEATSPEEKTKLDKRIKKLEIRLSSFKKSLMEPRTIGSIVFNYKIYMQFLKRLKDMYYETHLYDDKLVILYGPREGHLTGELTLHDLTPLFEKYGQPSQVEIEVIRHDTV